MLTIGAMARKTGTKVQTIRYYEQIGLMPEPGRTEGGQRRYGDAELDRLSFVGIRNFWLIKCQRCKEENLSQRII